MLSQNATMNVEQLAYWASFAIPIVLLVVGISTEKLICGKPWCRSNFFVGVDLTTYFLAACLINVADLAKSKDRAPQSFVWTAAMITIGVTILFAQTAFHQEWERDEKSRAGQIVLLCIASNGVGLSLLYSFVRLKVGGYL